MKKKSRAGRNPSTKARKKPQLLGWEHTVVAKSGLLKLSEVSDEKAETHGCRTGKLKAEPIEKARRISKLHACWNCWVQKLPVRLCYWVQGNEENR
jgi:hypothetical protein